MPVDDMKMWKTWTEIISSNVIFVVFLLHFLEVQSRYNYFHVFRFFIFFFIHILKFAMALLFLWILFFILFIWSRQSEKQIKFSFCLLQTSLSLFLFFLILSFHCRIPLSLEDWLPNVSYWHWISFHKRKTSLLN